jgi:Fe-S cluster assembly iron-binding protein IscA
MLKLTESAKEEFRSVKETKRADELFVRVFVKGYG